MPDYIVQVCFVCLGNICRSPTAEGVMQRLVDDSGLGDKICVDSAGTAAYHVGERSDKRSREAARPRGIALNSRGRQFQTEDFERFDYVLAMDESNLMDLRALEGATEHSGHLGLLRAFDAIAPPGAEVPDPYYGGDSGFEDVLDLCEAACRGLLERIREDFELS